MNFRKGLTLICLVFMLADLKGQDVPTFMTFADQKLKITEAAKKEIQKDVDMLTRSPKHFKIKVDRANMYFGIIERVFREEGLPDDFKYLVLQESALIPDAVSTSNAVGFWQMKKTAAEEMGLRIDHMVDERMNIVASSRAAANYLKKYNGLFFHNWLFMLQSYNVGPGGGLRMLDKSKFGAKNLVVDKKTHWYVKKYLAHKIAFEGAIDSQSSPTKLAEISNQHVGSIKDISRKYNVDADHVKEYNKWLKGNKIPDDKLYYAVLPVTTSSSQNLLAMVNTHGYSGSNRTTTTKSKTSSSKSGRLSQQGHSITYQMGSSFPIIEKKLVGKSSTSFTIINGIPGVVAKQGNTLNSLSARGGMSVKKFRQINDIQAGDKVVPGQVYYFKKKRSKAKIHHYAVKPGEDLWSISQKFGLRKDKLMMKNRIRTEEKLEPGRVMWLRFIRPEEVAIEYIQIPSEEPEQIEEDMIEDKPLITEKKPPVTSTDKPMALDSQQPGNYVFNDKQAANKTNDSFQKTSTSMASNTQNEMRDSRNMNQSGNWSQGSGVKMVGQGFETDIEEFEVDEKPVFVGISAPSATERNGNQIHIIQPGETLFSIARTYDITVDELKSWNDLEDGNIKFDQELIVGKTDAGTETIANNSVKDNSELIIIHEVKQGETIYSISRVYNLPIQKILELNQKTSYDIAIGEKLKVVDQQ